MSFDKERFKEECDRRRNENLTIGGKTYDIKENIKELGGIWDGMKKVWLMPDQAALDKVKGLMGMGDAAPTEAPSAPQGGDDQPISPSNVPF